MLFPYADMSHCRIWNLTMLGVDSWKLVNRDHPIAVQIPCNMTTCDNSEGRISFPKSPQPKSNNPKSNTPPWINMFSEKRPVEKDRIVFQSHPFLRGYGIFHYFSAQKTSTLTTPPTNSSLYAHRKPTSWLEVVAFVQTRYLGHPRCVSREVCVLMGSVELGDGARSCWTWWMLYFICSVYFMS